MKKLLLVILCLSFAGCATGYHQKGMSGGFTDTKIQDDIYKVRFNGNGYCGSARAEDFALLRCAELSLENGYKYFIIIDEKSAMESNAVTTPVTANTYGTVNMYGNQGSYSGTTYYSGGQTYTFHKPSANNTIKCFKDKPQDSNMMVYDAEQIKQNIRKQYKLDEEVKKEEPIEAKKEAPKPTQNF